MTQEPKHPHNRKKRHPNLRTQGMKATEIADGQRAHLRKKTTVFAKRIQIRNARGKTIILKSFKKKPQFTNAASLKKGRAFGKAIDLADAICGSIKAIRQPQIPAFEGLRVPGS